MCRESARDRAAVVLVDDDTSYLEQSRRLLCRYTNQIELVLLPNAELAVDRFQAGLSVVDLIVLAAQLPGMTGVEACRALRSSGVATPIAVTSGAMTTTLECAAYAAGATYVLPKPIDLPALIDQTTAFDLLDHDQRQLLITDHVDIARNIARKLARKYGSMLPAADFDGSAMVGLCEAAARYGLTRAEPFVAFAESRIRGAVLDEIRRVAIHSRTGYKRARRISTIRRDIVHTGHEATDGRVAERLGPPVSSVHETTVPSPDIRDLPDLGESPRDRVESMEVLVVLERARRVLPEQPANIMTLRYELGMSMEEIALRLDLTHGRVLKLHALAIARLRGALCA